MTVTVATDIKASLAGYCAGICANDDGREATEEEENSWDDIVI